MYIDNKADIDTKKLVVIWDALFPIIFPKKPEITDANKGKKIINFSTLSL